MRRVNGVAAGIRRQSCKVTCATTHSAEYTADRLDREGRVFASHRDPPRSESSASRHFPPVTCHAPFRQHATYQSKRRCYTFSFACTALRTCVCTRGGLVFAPATGISIGTLLTRLRRKGFSHHFFKK